MAYAPLGAADRSLIAWEWLRRNPVYRASVATALRLGIAPRTVTTRAHPFGLIAFEPPQLTVPAARPFWQSRIHPFVLNVVQASRAAADDLFDPASLGGLSLVMSGSGRDHLLISDGFGMVRLEGPRGIFSNGPTRLCFMIEGVGSAKAPLLALQRFIAVARSGRFSRLQHQREPKAQRWVLLLRTADALAGGASQRHLAEALLSRSASQSDWRSRDPPLRSQAQRLVRSARCLVGGGYADLLG